ncbi:MAG: hypothetical protein QOF77_11 [Solirubrobacteraceae bacterium]|nr:hypothetical protein [Solirubrobacteraceae bacterium]
MRPRDRLLVEWVAGAAAGDRVPEPWRWARSPTQSVILTLAGLGVIQAPPPGADLARVVEEAAVSARAWLVEHPPGPGTIVPPA